MVKSHHTLSIRRQRGIVAILTVTARGQLTLRKEVLQHLGVKPGDKIELDLLPDATSGSSPAAPPAHIWLREQVKAGK